MAKTKTYDAETLRWHRKKVREAMQQWPQATEDERVDLAVTWLPGRCKEIDVDKVSDLSALARLICSYPRVAQGMDITKFSDEDVSHILCMLPKRITEIPPERLPKLDWGSILLRHPSLAKFCDYHWLKAVDWGTLLRENKKKFMEQFDPSMVSGVDDWAFLVLTCPFLWRLCPFEEFDRKGKIKMANVCREFAKRLNLKTLTIEEWCQLMRDPMYGSRGTQRWIASELRRLSGHLCA